MNRKHLYPGMRVNSNKMPSYKPGCLVKLIHRRDELNLTQPGYSKDVVSRYGIGLYLGPSDENWERARHKIYWFNLKESFNMAGSVFLEVISE